MRIPAKKKISARSHKQRVHDIVAREKAVREDYDNIRLGHTAMRVEFDQQRRAKAKAKVKGKEMQAKIENLEMIIKEYYVEGDRVDLMEERFPVLMASRVERLKRQILEEERDQQLAEGQAVWIIQRAWRRYLIIRDIRREEAKRTKARKHIDDRVHAKSWHHLPPQEAEFEYQNSRPHVPGKYEPLPKGPLSVHARNVTNEKKKKEWKEERAASALRREMDACTFKPSIHTLPAEHKKGNRRATSIDVLMGNVPIEVETDRRQSSIPVATPPKSSMKHPQHQHPHPHPHHRSLPKKPSHVSFSATPSKPTPSPSRAKKSSPLKTSSRTTPPPPPPFAGGKRLAVGRRDGGTSLDGGSRRSPNKDKSPTRRHAHGGGGRSHKGGSDEFERKTGIGSRAGGGTAAGVGRGRNAPPPPPPPPKPGHAKGRHRDAEAPPPPPKSILKLHSKKRSGGSRRVPPPPSRFSKIIV
eukprot:gene15751-30538_t